MSGKNAIQLYTEEAPHRGRAFRLGADGDVRVGNPSAFWLPAFTLKKEVGGTTYSVTGSYEGLETLDRKLTRILAQNIQTGEGS